MIICCLIRVISYSCFAPPFVYVAEPFELGMQRKAIKRGLIIIGRESERDERSEIRWFQLDFNCK